MLTKQRLEPREGIEEIEIVERMGTDGRRGSSVGWRKRDVRYKPKRRSDGWPAGKLEI